MIFAKNNTLWRDAVCAKSAGICEICGNKDTLNKTLVKIDWPETHEGLVKEYERITGEPN